MHEHSSESGGFMMLPHFFTYAGLALTLGGLIAGFARFVMGIKPGFLKMRVFAVYSSYFDKKYFQFIQNNISEEISGILLLVGLLLLAFSEEKTEHYEFRELRLRAFMYSAYLSTVFLLAAFIFFYGLAFVSVMSLYIFMPLALYVLFFRYLLFQNRKYFRD